MKKRFFINNNLFIIMLAVLFALSSCEYQEYADVEFPEQTVYMPTAYNGIYDITEAADTYAVPTEGETYRYYINDDETKLVIPLSVYRSGITNEGGFTVNIAANNDTVNQLINTGVLSSVEVITTGMIELPASVSVKDGSSNAKFELSIDLSVLKNDLTKQYVTGVEISSTDREVNTGLNTTIILIKANSITY